MKTSVSERRIRVLLIDDHRLMVDGITSMLRNISDIEVVGSGSSGEEAINKSRSLSPDVILMDILMPGMTGIEATRWIKEQDPRIKVILISSEIRKDLVTAGIHVHIDGYLPKDIGKTTLLEAIRSVYRGNRCFDEAITSLVFEDFYNKSREMPADSSQNTPNDLTTREVEVLTHVASGKSNRQIADELFISTRTVETHKRHILEKLNLRNTAELVRYAIRNKLISLE